MVKSILLSFILLLFSTEIFAQHFPFEKNRIYNITDTTFTIPRNTTRAITETVGINLGVFTFNRFIMNEDFARVNLKTMETNLKRLPKWDTDKFSTNLVAHPYHGALYFNAARNNGMGFWQSIPYTLGGSIMWEYLLEREPPSLNDLISTTTGGVSLGEMTFRLSDLFIDNRTTGSERIGREILLGIVSPIRAVNRLVTGDAWKVKAQKGNSFNNVPVNFMVNVGARYLAEQEELENKSLGTNIMLRIDYGDPYNQDYYKPYEWFRLRIGMDVLSSQPFVSQVNATGILWGKEIYEKRNQTITAGIFQHLNYYDSNLKIGLGAEKKSKAPYRISEVASIGGGLLYKRKAENDSSFEVYAEAYLSGIILGASNSDHFHVDERDYNMGSGYSMKTYAGLLYKKRWGFMMNTENYQIFTWKGYNENIDWATVDPEVLNAQGDEGNARLTVFTTSIYYMINPAWNIRLQSRNFFRRTHYKLYDDIEHSTADLMLSVGLRL